MRTIRPFWLVLVSLVFGCTSTPARSPDVTAPAGVPAVTIASPAPGTTILVGETLQVNVRGEDVAGVSRLDLRVGDVLVDTASTANAAPQSVFSAVLEWRPSAEGSVVVSALAYRPTGTGSLPATIDVTVVSPGSLGSVPASFDPAETPALADASTPTEAPRPSVPPAPPTAAPSAAPSEPPPTPAPTPSPIAADLEVYMKPRDVPAEWTVGREVGLKIYVRNHDGEPAPAARIRVRAAGGTGRASIGGILPGAAEHYTVHVTPEAAGTRMLRIRIALPDGYADADPSNNEWSREIEVSPVATPAPSITPSPASSTTPAPSDDAAAAATPSPSEAAASQAP